MDVNQLLIITRFLEVHTEHGAEVACQWADEREQEVNRGEAPNLAAPVSLDTKPSLRIVG